MATEVLQGMKDATVKFFELPLEEKNKIRFPPGGIDGYGQIKVVPEGQAIDWSDGLVLNIYPANGRNLEFWPDSPNGFKYVSKLNSGKYIVSSNLKQLWHA